MIRCENICLRKGPATLLDAIDFEVPEGAGGVIAGASGSGKTTLLRCLAGLEDPSAGLIALAGRTVFEGGKSLVAPHRRDIALVQQDLGLWPHLTALRHLRLAGASAEEARTALDEFGLSDQARRQVGTLSGGEQQRVALTMALHRSPKILLMDEPFTALDLLLRTELIDHVARWCRENGASWLLVTHDPGEARRLGATHGLFLDGGQTVAAGPLDQIFEEPEHEMVARWADTWRARKTFSSDFL